VGHTRCRQEVRHRKQKCKIISASSIAGHDGFAMLGVCSATKFAVLALTQVAAQEYGSARITGQRVLPRHRRHRHLGEHRQAVRRDHRRAGGCNLQKYVGGIAPGRSQTPGDVASLVSFLAAPDSDYMTGQAPAFDGGLVDR
jgi:meso-butanediol dehydrogenase/(S,S)-butanediol dehydrogenase/diacetyl reductase